MSEKDKYVMDENANGHGDVESGHNHIQRAGRAPWRALFNFTTSLHTVPFILAFSFSVASGIVIPALAVFLGKIFNEFATFGAGQTSGHHLTRTVTHYSIILCGLGGASGVLNGAYYGLWLVFGELQAKSARQKLFVGMLNKEMEWYDMRTSGIEPLVSRLQTQIRELQLATSQPIGFTVQYTTTTIAALVVAFYYSWNLTLVTLASLPFSAIVLAWISARLQPGVNAQAEALTIASKFASNAISAIDTVKCFNGHSHELWQYSKSVKHAAKYYLIQARANALQISFMRLVTLGMFVQGFWFGTYLVGTGKKNSGDIVTAFMAALMAAQSVEQILPQFIVIEKGKVAGATLKEIMVQIENGREIRTMMGGRKLPNLEGNIEIRNVSFTYPLRTGHKALDEVNIFFPAGQTTFVIGKSGSGKSTLGNLLLRFYSPSSGQIFIDGNPIQTLDLKWLRGNITLVQQQSVLFNETIFKNISLGRQDYSITRKEDLKRSIESAFLTDVIKNMPKKFDTVVGSGGSTMSGGQKQRVALARAHFRDTPILILDEATSALDGMTKANVVEAIRQWRHGKTTVIITHDMSQVSDDDYAYVLDGGRIVQEGFKSILRKATNGPFSESLPSPVDSPRSSREKLAFLKSPKLHDVRMRPSDESIKRSINPKSGFIPSVFIASPKQSRIGRRSTEILSPRALPVFLMHHSTLAAAESHRLKRKSMESLNIADFIELADLNNNSISEDLADRPKYKKFDRPERIQFSKIFTNKRSYSAISPIPKHSFQNSQALSRSTQRKEAASIKAILSTVWPTLTWLQRFILVTGFLCATVHAAATPVFSWLFSKLLTALFLHESTRRSRQALQWSLSVLGVAIVDSVASYLMHYLLEYCSQVWIDASRVEALNRILNQPRSWFEVDENSPTILTECLDRNAEEMRNLLGRFAGFSFVAVMMMMIGVLWSLVLSWKFTLVGLASAPILYALTRSFEYVSGKWEDKSNDRGSAANSVFNETISNIRTVRALTLEGYFHEKYFRATHKAFNTGLKRSTCTGFFFGLSDSAILFVEALVFWFGARITSSNRNSIQNILTVLSMLLFSIANANAIIAFIPQISSSRSTATRLLRLAQLPHRNSHEHTGHVRLAHPSHITFNSLSFTYPARPNFPALSSLSLTLQPGCTLALAGASGSGKSTIASLLLGLYPPTHGSITINHIPLRSIHLATLRSRVALVPQQPTLFPASVADNIAYALPERSPLASAPSIRAAAQAAGIHDFIMGLPEGYDTHIGPGGTGLSGGQQQRIAIARAVVRKPSLLVLDEATSGLDRETARCVRELVRRCRRDWVGVLVISHERAMLECCEEVAVVKDGRVVERAGFARLMRREGGKLRRLLGEEGR